MVCGHRIAHWIYYVYFDDSGNSGTKTNEEKIPIPAMSLFVIELFCNLSRTILIGVDPYWSMRIFPYFWGSLMLTSNITWGLVSSLIIAFVYARSLSLMSSLSSIRLAIKIIIGSLSILIIAFDLFLSIQQGLFHPQTSESTILFVSFILVSTLCTLVMFEYYGYQVLTNLKKFENISEQRQSIVFMTRRLMLSGFFMILFLITGSFTPFSKN